MWAKIYGNNKEIVTQTPASMHSYRMEWDGRVVVDIARFAIISKAEGKGYIE